MIRIVVAFIIAALIFVPATSMAGVVNAVRGPFIITEGHPLTFNDPLYMPQAILLTYATDCIDAASAGKQLVDPVACCQALELSHDLIVKTDMPIDSRLVDQGLELYAKMDQYINNDLNSIGTIGYDGCSLAGEL